MSPEDFEVLLDEVVERLTAEVRESAKYHGANDFEVHVKEVLTEIAHGKFIALRTKKARVYSSTN